MHKRENGGLKVLKDVKSCVF